MLSSMSAVVLRPSGRVTVISPSLTSNRPDTGSPVMSWKVISLLMAPSPRMSSSDHNLEPRVPDSPRLLGSRLIHRRRCRIWDLPAGGGDLTGTVGHSPSGRPYSSSSQPRTLPDAAF